MGAQPPETNIQTLFLDEEECCMTFKWVVWRALVALCLLGSLRLPWTGQLSIAQGALYGLRFTQIVGGNAAVPALAPWMVLSVLLLAAPLIVLFFAARRGSACRAGMLAGLAGLLIFPLLVAANLHFRVWPRLNWGYWVYLASLTLTTGLEVLETAMPTITRPLTQPVSSRRAGARAGLALILLPPLLISAVGMAGVHQRGTLVLVHARLLDGSGAEPVTDAVVVVREGQI